MNALTNGVPTKYWTYDLGLDSDGSHLNLAGSVLFFAYQQIHAIELIATGGVTTGNVVKATLTIEQFNCDEDGASSDLVVVNLNAGTYGQ